MFNQLPELTALAGTLPEYAGLPAIAVLRALFGEPVFVWVSREDKVRQAVSMWRALQSRHWRGEQADVERDDERDRTSGNAMYSYDGIDHLVRRFEQDDRGWRDWFETNSLSPLHVSYERLSADRAATVREVLAAIGVSPPAGWSAPEPIRRQSDATSAQWVAAYRRERAARGLTAPSADTV
jgi:LPS sulfotransferase NodH